MLFVGLDIESVAEVKKKEALVKSQAFFTKSELSYCNNKIDSFTGLICLKESVIKAISSIGKEVPQYTYKDIELRHNVYGKPYIQTHNNLKKFMTEEQYKIEVSITHTLDVASSISLVYKLF